MTFDALFKELKKKTYRPIYFLCGEEPYFIDVITDYIAENVLSETEKDFNQTVLYGKDTQIEDLINTAKRFPVMSEYQVVIVKEAQHVKNIEKLVFYAEKPAPKTILVLNYKYKTLDKRKKLYKLLDKSHVLFESKKLYENKIPAWITQYLKQKGYQATPVAGKLLTDFLGTDLQKIANELDKLIISLPAGTTITPAEVEENIGISKDYNNFELQNALKDRDIQKANRIIKHFAANPKDNPIVLTIISLYSFFSKVLLYQSLKDKNKANLAAALKINPYFVQNYATAASKYSIGKTVKIIGYLREYDMKSKGYNNVSATHGELLKELIFKILH